MKTRAIPTLSSYSDELLGIMRFFDHTGGRKSSGKHLLLCSVSTPRHKLSHLMETAHDTNKDIPHQHVTDDASDIIHDPSGQVEWLGSHHERSGKTANSETRNQVLKKKSKPWRDLVDKTDDNLPDGASV